MRDLVLGRSWFSLGLRLLALSLLGIGCALIWRYRIWFDPASLQAVLIATPWAPLVFIGAHVIASLIFVPRTILALAAGLVFGLWWGIILTTIGAMAGAMAGFFLARGLNGGLFWLERLPRLGHLIQRLESGGWRAVMLVRLVPVMPHTPVNYAFGLTQIPVMTYFWGSFLGLLPSTLVIVSIGAAGSQAIGGTWHWVEPMLIGFVALGLSYLLRRQKA